jgi:hypothetical protein
MGRQYSISHSVLDKLYAERNAESVPPLARVFTTVHNWFVERTGKVGKCPLNVKIVYVAGIPVVYGSPNGRNRFPGTKHEEWLLLQVRDTLFSCHRSDASSSAAVSEEAITPRSITGPVAPLFLKPSMPTELQPVSEGQQRVDIDSLCRFLKMSPEDWPNPPDATVTVGAPSPVLIRTWNDIKSTRTLGIGDWVKLFTATQPSHEWLWALAVLMRKLDDWSSDATTVFGRRGYLKTAVPFIRRVLIATRGMCTTDAVAVRILTMTGKQQ